MDWLQTYRHILAEKTAEKTPDDIEALDSMPVLDESTGSWQALLNRLQLAVQRGALQDVCLVTFPGGAKLVLVHRGGEPFVMDSPAYPFFQSAIHYIYDLRDEQLVQFYPEADEALVSDKFWQDVGAGFVVYHGTSRAYVQDILLHGLCKSNKTRGVSNRGIRSAVFTSTDLGGTTVYGEVCLRIDVSAMKRDGFMPEVGYEWPLWYENFKEAMAHRLGIEYFGSATISDGLSNNTIIFFADIPAKYVRLQK